MLKEIDIELLQPISYAHKGDSVEAMFVKLLPPTSKNIVECAALKQAFFRALPKDGAVEAETSPDSEGEITGDAIMTLIAMSTTVDLGPVLLTAKELLTSGVALVDGEEKLTKPLFDLLCQDDVEALTGGYMANFILASALQRLKKS